MGIFDRVMHRLDQAESGLGSLNETLQHRTDAAPPKQTGLTNVSGPVGWLHRHDVAARLIFLAGFLGFVVVGGSLVGQAPDPVIAVTLGLAVLCLVLVVWFALYGGDWF